MRSFIERNNNLSKGEMTMPETTLGHCLCQLEGGQVKPTEVLFLLLGQHD